MTLPDRRQAAHWAGLLVLVVVVVVPFVVYAAPWLVGGDASYVVLSGSMEPEISSGDVVVVESVDPATIEEGDVITYSPNAEEVPTTHRVIEVTERAGEIAFHTQGDANDEPDASPVAASDVEGTVMVTIPYIGHVIDVVNTPLGFAALIGVPIVLLLGSELLARRSDDRESAAEGTRSDVDDTAGPQAESDSTADRPDPASSSSTSETTDDDTIAITRADLRLSLGLLAAATVYTVWVVMHVRMTWSFAALFASVAGLVAVATMYQLADRPTSAAGARPSQADDETGTDTDEYGTADFVCEPDGIEVLDRSDETTT